jgi:hypothetical protein
VKLLSLLTLLSLADIPPPVAAQTQGLDAFRELRGRLASGRETASLSASMTTITEKPSMEAAKAAQSRSNVISSRSVPKGRRYTDATDRLPLTTSTSSDDPKSVVRAAACRWGVPPDLALALFEHESGIRNAVVGEQGEIGLPRLCPQRRTSTASILIGCETISATTLIREYGYSAIWPTDSRTIGILSCGHTTAGPTLRVPRAQLESRRLNTQGGFDILSW